MQYEKWDYFKVASTELAQALGVTRGTIWRWQTGLSRPTRRHQERVEQVLQELAPLVLPDLRSEKPDQKSGRIIRPNAPTRLQPLPNSKDREPTLFENERTFRQAAHLVSEIMS
jgi:transcriptional regulator with XRE-family HTH domain